MKQERLVWMVRHVPIKLIERIKAAALKNKRYEYEEVIDRLEKSFNK